MIPFSFIDERGMLISFDKLKDNLPFDVKRIYFIYADLNSSRGFHKHIKLKQFFILLNGEVEICVNKNNSKQIITLREPGNNFLLEGGYYRKIYFKKNNSILAVLASENYDPDDYYYD